MYWTIRLRYKCSRRGNVLKFDNVCVISPSLRSNRRLNQLVNLWFSQGLNFDYNIQDNLSTHLKKYISSQRFWLFPTVTAPLKINLQVSRRRTRGRTVELPDIHIPPVSPNKFTFTTAKLCPHLIVTYHSSCRTRSALWAVFARQSLWRKKDAYVWT